MAREISSGRQPDAKADISSASGAWCSSAKRRTGGSKAPTATGLQDFDSWRVLGQAVNPLLHAAVRVALKPTYGAGWHSIFKQVFSQGEKYLPNPS